ncbi:MAG TPA: hypothetical protein VD735_04960, partial [Candidatus Saccharimonadales bacterium]|nr:hypothetical protein [Candidatus Saccharimonadales bacterium]
MRERFSAWFIVLKQFVLGHRKAVIGAGAGLMVLVLLACTVPYWVISPSGKYVLDDRASIQDKHIAVGLVLGA